jgi:diketogulonate reductase-like aldo/keto reductase
MGIAVVAYASLGCGQLLQHPVVVDIAKETGKTAAQVRFRSVNWCFGFAS